MLKNWFTEHIQSPRSCTDLATVMQLQCSEDVATEVPTNPKRDVNCGFALRDETGLGYMHF